MSARSWPADALAALGAELADQAQPPRHGEHDDAGERGQGREQAELDLGRRRRCRAGRPRCPRRPAARPPGRGPGRAARRASARAAAAGGDPGAGVGLPPHQRDARERHAERPVTQPESCPAERGEHEREPDAERREREALPALVRRQLAPDPARLERAEQPQRGVGEEPGAADAAHEQHEHQAHAQDVDAEVVGDPAGDARDHRALPAATDARDDEGRGRGSGRRRLAHPVHLLHGGRLVHGLIVTRARPPAGRSRPPRSSGSSRGGDRGRSRRFRASATRQCRCHRGSHGADGERRAAQTGPIGEEDEDDEQSRPGVAGAGGSRRRRDPARDVGDAPRPSQGGPQDRGRRRRDRAALRDRPDAGAGRVRGLAVLRGRPAGLPRRHPRPPAGRRDGPAPRDAGVGDRHRDAPRHRRGRLGVLRRPRHGDRHRRRGRPALRAAPQPRSPAGPAAPRRGRRRDAHGRARGRPEAAVVGSARRGTVRLGPPGARAAARAAEAAARRSCP